MQPEVDFNRPKRVTPELNIAPLIDVVFLLLVFFMLTSSMIKPKMIKLDLPSSTSAENTEQELINLSVDVDQNYFLDGQPVPEQQLTEKLKQFLTGKPDGQITLSADKKLSSQGLINALDLVRKEGGTNIAVATK